MALEYRLTALADDLYKMYGGKLPVDMGTLLNAADAMSAAVRALKEVGLVDGRGTGAKGKARSRP